MAEQFTNGSIAAPGFSGLNTQDSSVQLSSGFALRAENCVIDKYGRIGARKGWDNVNATALASSGNVRTVFEFVKSDGNLTFAALDNKIYGNIPSTTTYAEYPVAGIHFYTGTYAQSGTTVTVTSVENHNLSVGDTVWFDASSGTTADGFYTVATVPSAKIFTFTTTSATTSGNCQGINILTTYSITADNWQALNMPLGSGITASAHAIWLQAGHIPLVMHKLGTVAHSHADGYGFQRLGDVATLPTGYTTDTFKPSCGTYAFGRLWVAGVNGSDTQTVYFSDLQDPAVWTTGTSGKLDISAVIPTGDPITAIAQHNGFLIIFCKKHIVVYSGAKDPSTMTLSDTITGIGCIARDTVQSVAGTDILFLSETGVQSLQRVIQEKSMPFRDISKNVRDNLIADVANETVANIKGIYFSTDAFYLLALPTSGNTYCFDTRGTLENGAARATIWRDINPTAFCITYANELYMGKKGYIGKYMNYTDNGSVYRMSYYTNYFDMGDPTSLKILKKVNITSIGGSQQVLSIKWGYDYTDNYKAGTIQLDQQAVSEYGVAEYGIGTYNNGIVLDTTQIQTSGNGKVVQLGFESDINGNPLSVQKIDFFIKLGKHI
jgi:hypothetical protein